MERTREELERQVRWLTYVENNLRATLITGAKKGAELMNNTKHELRRDASIMRDLGRIADALERLGHSPTEAQRLALEQTGRCPVCGQDER